MRKILKFIKHNVLIFIAGAVIFGSLGVYAATVIAASSVSYSDSNDLGADNVQDAIDKLNAKATTKIAEAKKECPSGSVCTKTWAKIGDYVSMKPISTSYATNTSMTGYSSTQTLNPSELNLWRVIRINSDGTIEMVSEYVSSVDVHFENKTGYQNFVGYLNTIAKQYENETYTISSRHIGYSNQTPYITDTSALDSRTAPLIPGEISVTFASLEEKGFGDILNGYETDYNLVNDAIGTLKAYKAGTINSNSYWLASRKYSYYTSASWGFGVRYVYTDGGLSLSNLYYFYSGRFLISSESAAIRPIVTLKSGLSPTGTGTSSNPYKLS